MKTKDKLRPEDPQTYEAFVKMACRMAHDGLLSGGGKGMYSEMFSILSFYPNWLERYKNTEGLR